MAESDQQQTPAAKKKKLPQGKTQASRDMHPDSEAEIRDDVPVAAEIRLIPDAGDDVGEGEVQDQIDQENEVGFRGATADPTPNENYTVAGVVEGKPTPETHFGQRRAAKAAGTLNEGVEPY